jgi:hypothetical protein
MVASSQSAGRPSFSFLVPFHHRGVRPPLPKDKSMIITVTLLASILVASIVVWLFRQRLAQHLPSKEVMTTVCLFAPIAMLVVLAILPDILLLFATINFMPHSFKIVLALAAATMVCVGCYKQTDTPKPRRLQWSAPETGFQSETTFPPDTKPKEAQ